MKTFSFEAIGTHWEIDIYSPVSEQTYGYLQTLITKSIDEYDRIYSRFRADSYINLTLSQVGSHTPPPDAKPLFDLYHKLYTLTGGLFTPLVGQLLIDAGYNAEYSFQEKPLHTPPRLDEVIDFSYPQVTVKKQEIFDFGAGGKGYLIDIISDLLKEQGIVLFCIDAGGDIRYEHTNPLRVGLENPHNVRQAIGVMTLTHPISLCASAGSRRKWGSYHHIMNPHTLSSPKKISATWVLSDTTLLADCLATCLFLVDPEMLTPHFSYEYLILFDNHSFQKSSQFSSTELFLR